MADATDQASKIKRVRTGCWTCKKRYERYGAGGCLYITNSRVLTYTLSNIGVENAMKESQNVITASKQEENVKGMG